MQMGGHQLGSIGWMFAAGQSWVGPAAGVQVQAALPSYTAQILLHHNTHLLIGFMAYSLSAYTNHFSSCASGCVP